MMISHPWLIPLIPGGLSVVMLFFGSRTPGRGAPLGIAAMIISLGLSLWVIVDWITGPRIPLVSQHIWFSVGGVDVTAGTITDGMTATMAVVVSLVSLLVQIYSVEYMRLDKRFTHFFAILTLFTGAMEWFVMSANTLQMIFGWEVMSLCSFLLIGHWWEEKSNVHAAMKAFLTTKASDVGLFVGVIALFFGANETFDIVKLNDAANNATINHGALVVGAIALFVAVIGKSAQFPLHTWLPDAMAGPTPMSALIHAATMVVAGVFLLGRLYPVFAHAFSIAPLGAVVASLNPVAIIGAITIVIAALLAFVQTDIKKVLSYSTVSQLGYMVMAMGVGAWTAAMFHLVTHAIFKSLLFLSAGSVSHAVHGFDLEKDMGGLKKSMPITHATFGIGALSLIGIVPLAGFWSKEQITAQAGANGYTAFQVVALVGTFMTAAYMVRTYMLMFRGEHRGSSRPHESPKALTIPCVILALIACVIGFLQAPALHVYLFQEWVTPASFVPSTDEASIALPFTIEILVVALGIVTAALAARRGIGPVVIARRFKAAKVGYVFLHNRYYIDWLYEKVIVLGIRRGLAWLVHWVDHNIVDSFVDLVGNTTVRMGQMVDSAIDRKLLDGTVQAVSLATEEAGSGLARFHNGRVQRYVCFAVLALAAAVFVVVTGK